MPSSATPWWRPPWRRLRGAYRGYYRAVAEATPLKIVLYTNSRFSELDLTPGLLERLVELPTVRYIKDASTNTGRLLSLITRFGDRLKVFAGALARAALPETV